MRRLALLAIVLVALSLTTRASARPPSFEEARTNVQTARNDETYAFCKKPKTPLGPEQRALCVLADDVEGCEGFAAACKGTQLVNKEKDSQKDSPSWAHGLLSVLSTFATGLLWLLIALVIAAIAVPLVAALLKARRDKAIADAPRAPNVATPTARAPPPPPEAISDAEAALREADEHLRRGELARALSLYLAASLAALDHRGAIRLARHRTNGEYVRSCAEDASRQSLREIVREVDRVEFGKVAPTLDGVSGVAARASNVVRGIGLPRTGAARSLATMALSLLTIVTVLFLTGCGGSGHRGRLMDDPAGDQLPLDLLSRNGYDVAHLGSSLESLPLPSEHRAAPIVAIDVERVLLEEETVTHLLAWVHQGGVLVLFGAPIHWPKELHAEQASAKTRDLEILGNGIFSGNARVAVPRTLVWSTAQPTAFLGDSVYAAHIFWGEGVVLGVAGDELLTNVGVSHADNAAAFVALFEIATTLRIESDARRGILEPATSYEVRFAEQQDGIAPPSNPLSALVQAGLGKGTAHALVAALILFLAFGIRHARARPTAPPARRAFAEHVEATGAFYGRARALGHALSAYGRFAEMRVRERIPRGGDPIHFLAARAKVAPEEASRLWKRATEATDEDPLRGDELQTIRDLGALLTKALETT